MGMSWREWFGMKVLDRPVQVSLSCRWHATRLALSELDEAEDCIKTAMFHRARGIEALSCETQAWEHASVALSLLTADTGSLSDVR